MPSTVAPSPEARALRALVDLDRELQVALPAAVPHLPAAEARLAAGIPALYEEPIVAGESVCAALRSVAALLATEPGFAPAHHAAERMSADAELASSVAVAALSGDWDSIEGLATRLGLDPHASIAIADYAVRPWLRLAASAVGSLVAASGWQSGHCPACGALPIFAELRGPTRERFLRCARCSSAWPFRRLACASCGERRHQQLNSLHAEGEAEFRRADVCETCHGYVKGIAVLAPLDPVALLETDLATSALDFAAIELGYRRLQLRGA
jgi:FdhE protein